MDDTVKPIALAETTLVPELSLRNESRFTGSHRCVVMGWGITETRYQSAILLSASVKVMSHAYCKSLQTNFRNEYLNLNDDFEFCAGQRQTGNVGDMPDSCKADSGGPLVCSDSNGLVQHGIVSWGGERCGEHREPGVYANVASASSWIKNVTGTAQYLFDLNLSKISCPVPSRDCS